MLYTYIYKYGFQIETFKEYINVKGWRGVQFAVLNCVNIEYEFFN